ncbi:MAG: hypothetical protein WDW36_006944 [Sanguina aurantia]
MGDGSDVVIRRGEAISGPPGPILIATRNDDLQAIVDATPAERRQDLVFMQNGMLQPWLEGQGLGNNTQVLVYFAVAKKGDAPGDGKTNVNPEGLTAAHGLHADAVAARLHSGGLSCKVLEKPAFQQAMLEKLVWISAMMAVGAEHGVTVGEVESTYASQVLPLMMELLDAGCAAMGISPAAGAMDRLMAYARSVAHFPTALKEFKWRNGWFHGLTLQAASQGKADPCPLHTALLLRLKAIPAAA